MLAPGRAADVAFHQIETGQIERFQHPHSFARHFRADAVTGENRNPHRANLHGVMCPLIRGIHPRQQLGQALAGSHNITAPLGKRPIAE